jgi:hypothetical protein
MFDHFNVWWDALMAMQKVYWMIAIPFSIIFILQLIISFFSGDGGGHDASAHDGASGDTDHGMPFQFFTLKNMIAFFTLFGWAGIACLNNGLGNVTAIIFSTLSGLAIMTIMASIFYFMSKMVESGNLDIKNALNKTGSVYIPVPANRSGKGKVQIKVQHSLREMDVVTDEEQIIPTGTLVVVTETLDGNLLVVKKA